MKVFVQCLSSKKLSTLELNPSDSVLQLKTYIEEKQNISVEDQVLSYQSKPLQDQQKLQDYNIRDNSTLDLNIRLRGGSKVHCLVESPEIKKNDVNKAEISKPKSLKKKTLAKDFLKPKEDLLPEGYSDVEELQKIHLQSIDAKIDEGNTLLNEIVVNLFKNNTDVRSVIDGLNEQFQNTDLNNGFVISSDGHFLVGTYKDSIKVFNFQTKELYHNFENVESTIN